MTEIKARIANVAIVFALASGLNACVTFKQEMPDQKDVIFVPRQVETLGETIAREQTGANGCLVAGNLNNSGECKKLRAIVFPPPPSSKAKS